MRINITTLLLAFCSIGAFAADFDGNGTEASPYLLRTPEDLKTLSDKVKTGNSYRNNYFALDADIDLASDTQFAPIGNKTATFEGNLNGRNHTISNLSISYADTDYAGLFGYIGENASVSHLSLTVARLEGTGKYYGAIAGRNDGAIEDCHVSGTIATQGAYTGGIAGISSGSLYSSSFTGNISGYGYVGGLAGDFSGTMDHCSVTANVVVTGSIDDATDGGGLAGRAISWSKKECVITDSYFCGTLSDKSGKASLGGIAPVLWSARVERCFNTGSINGSGKATNIGGVAGLARSSTIKDCYNAGTVTHAADSAAVAGGIIGYYYTLDSVDGSKVYYQSTVTDCYNSGLVRSSSTNPCKGIYGLASSQREEDPTEGMLTGCYSDNQVTGLKDTRFGTVSATLCGGKLPEGFSSEVWTASAGLYPTLAAIEPDEAVSLSSAAFLLATGERIGKVKTDVALHASNGAVWKLLNISTSELTDETAGLKIEGNTLKLKDRYSQEVLVATTADNAAMRLYPLSVVSPTAFEGKGSEASPYLIRSKSDFITLSNAVQTHSQSHEGDYFRLTADIDFNYADDFQGVGGNAGKNFFGGIFDGNGHTIHKLKIHSATYDASGKGDASKGAYSNAGLFNACSSESVIRNLTIAQDCDFDFWSDAAPIAGYTAGRIENCRNYASVTGIDSNIGGIAGTADSTAVITGCYNAGAVLAGSSNAGGIAGWLRGAIELCQNDGAVSADYHNAFSAKGKQHTAGGIAGMVYGTVNRCVNNADVLSYAKSGGIAGNVADFYRDGTVTNNISTGQATTLQATEQRGGIIGFFISSKKVANNYYDNSININGGANNSSVPGISGLPTATLIAGKAPEGFDANGFDFAPNLYPSLSAFSAEPKTVALRSTYVKFADGEIRTNIMTAATMSPSDKIQWTLKGSDAFAIDGQQLTVTTPTDMTVADATLTASYNNGEAVKSYALKAIPQNLFEGKGTADNPYLLKTTTDLGKLADFMALSGMEYEGYTFKVANDIEYADGEAFKPIADGSVNFQGTLDGNGKTIKGYNFTGTDYESNRYTGFFCNVGASGKIHDLTLAGAITGQSFLGGFAAKLYGSIENCVNRSRVTSTQGSRIGGIAAQAFSGASIRNCRNEAEVRALSGNYAGGVVATLDAGATIENTVNSGVISATSGYVAGIAADAAGTILNSRNETALEGKANIAGLVAKATEGLSIDGSSNAASITASGASAAGLVATATGAVTIRNSQNTGKITAAQTVAGVIATAEKGLVASDCYNAGEVTATEKEVAGGFAGTVKGTVAQPSSIARCYNTAAVTGMAKTGGLVGVLADKYTSATDCYNTATVTSPSVSNSDSGIGGLFGEASGSIIRCWNSGAVSSVNAYNVGGVAGAGDGSADACFNLGNISTSVNNIYFAGAAGIWGTGKVKISNCYNMGAVTGPAKIAGIVAAASYSATISDCYNAGVIKQTASHPDLVANIANTNYGPYPETSYFDKDINPEAWASDAAAGAVGLTSQAMQTAPLGDSFVYRRAAYPTLPGILEQAHANFAAANIAFKEEGDNAENVNGIFFVGLPDFIEWTSSDNISIAADGTASTSATGKGWVKASATVGNEMLEKVFNLNIIHASSGINSPEANKTIASRVYYDLAGVEVSAPAEGVLYIVRTAYSDGTTAIAKQVYRK